MSESLDTNSEDSQQDISEVVDPILIEEYQQRMTALLDASILESCQQKDLDRLTTLLIDFPSGQNLLERLSDPWDEWIDQCINSCVSNNFLEGLNLLLAKLPKCQKSEKDPHAKHLLVAIKANNLDCARAFLEHGCNPNGGKEYHTPFWHIRSVAMAKLFIEFGANINFYAIPEPNSDDYYYEPYGSYDREIDDEPDIYIFGMLCEELCGYEAIYDTLPSGEKVFSEIAQLMLFLVDQGLDQITTKSHFRYLNTLLVENLQFFHKYLHLNLYDTDKEGNNLLHEVARNRDTKIIKYLLENGVPNAPNKYGHTPLAIAISFDGKFGGMAKSIELIQQYTLPITKRAK